MIFNSVHNFSQLFVVFSLLLHLLISFFSCLSYSSLWVWAKFLVKLRAIKNKKLPLPLRTISSVICKFRIWDLCCKTTFLSIFYPKPLRYTVRLLSIRIHISSLIPSLFILKLFLPYFVLFNLYFSPTNPSSQNVRSIDLSRSIFAPSSNLILLHSPSIYSTLLIIIHSCLVYAISSLHSRLSLFFTTMSFLLIHPHESFISLFLLSLSRILHFKGTVQRDGSGQN